MSSFSLKVTEKPIVGEFAKKLRIWAVNKEMNNSINQFSINQLDWLIIRE